MTRYEYRAVQVADGEDTYRTYEHGPLYFLYKSLAAARGRAKQIANVPGVKVQEIQRREIGPWETIE